VVCYQSKCKGLCEGVQVSVEPNTRLVGTFCVVRQAFFGRLDHDESMRSCSLSVTGVTGITVQHLVGMSFQSFPFPCCFDLFVITG
jgi:hypothetical protein